MKPINFYIILFFLAIICNQSCTPLEEQITDQNVVLRFSTDSLVFDTIFTDLKSVTKQLVVYNSSEKGINIDKIRLFGNAQASFSLVVNGQKANEVTDIFIRGKDSIRILASVNIPTNPAFINPFLITDSIEFVNNNISQKVIITAFGQNAKYYRGETISSNVVWDSTIAHFIFQTLTIAQGAELKILPGTKVYINDGQSLIINGNLMCEGDSNSRVAFRGRRLESEYQNVPSQWNGIVISSTTSAINLAYTSIRNAAGAIFTDTDEDINADITIKNCDFYNFNGDIIRYNGGKLKIQNSLFSNTSGACINLKNCISVELYNNTFATGGTILKRNRENILLESIADKIEILNNIIYGFSNIGNNQSELNIKNTDEIKINLKNNLIESNIASQTQDTHNIWNQYPKFRDFANYQFDLDSLSPAIDKAKTLTQFNIDFKGKLRPSKWDIGALERVRE